MKRLYLIIIILFISLKCEIYPPDLDIGFDFIEHFREAKIIPDTGKYNTPNGKIAFVHKKWNIYGEKRPAIVQIPDNPDGKISFNIPPKKNTGKLYFGISFSPPNPPAGEGGVGIITIEYDNLIDTVYRSYLNPVENMNERRWFDILVDLKKYSNKQISVSFSVTKGPNNHDVWGWFAWSSPVISSAYR